jgi:tripartite-type tricarboxylate transporter receptor subunit TctC
MIRFVFGLLALAMAGGAPAAAQSAYPDRPIRLVVPFPAGSSSDVIGRLLAIQLGEKLGQQVVIENRPGASGTLGVDVVAKATPDGYTMGVITGSTHAVSPALGAKLPYDAIKDFKPVTMLGAAPYVLVVYPGLKVKTVKELIEFAKKNPNKLNYGSAGLASLAHLAAAQFATQVGVDITHVPYKSSAQSVIDMITGRLDMQFATIAPVRQNAIEGKLQALATTGNKRVSALADVPTMIESGVPDYEVSLWMAFVMPAGTPDAIVNRLNQEMTAILNMPETQAAMRKQGFEPEPGPPANVTKRITSEIDRWRSLIEKTGIKPAGQ